MKIPGVALALAMPVGAMSSAEACEISKIAGEVFRFRNNAHDTIFVVTSQGIIATDPKMGALDVEGRYRLVGAHRGPH
jgi:hypothetical protein